MYIENLLVDEEFSGERLDSFISEQIEHLSRTLIKEMIENNAILVNEISRKASYKVKMGDKIQVALPENKEVEIEAQNIPLEIIYQDSDIAIINKAKGMVVHPAHGNWDKTLVNALLYHLKDLSGINGELRPGIVHRLDKDTSGVIVVAKNDFAHRDLSEQIRVHSIKREYIALVNGIIKDNLGIIDAPIGRSKNDRKKMAVVSDGKQAISEFQVVNRYQDFTLVKVRLQTGRTHQIRVHFTYIKHGVVGDPLYGSGKNRFNLNSQALHACLLGLTHPRSGEYMEFISPMPEYMEEIIKSLEEIH